MKLREWFARPERWIQDEFHAASGATCFVGGIDKCYPQMTSHQYLKLKRELGLDMITSWNDSKDRTFEEVQVMAARFDELAARMGVPEGGTPGG